MSDKRTEIIHVETTFFDTTSPETTTLWARKWAGEMRDAVETSRKLRLKPSRQTRRERWRRRLRRFFRVPADNLRIGHYRLWFGHEDELE